MKASEWIDQVKAKNGLESDYSVAQLLGLSRALVSSYRRVTPTFDEDTAIKVANALEIEPAIVLADQAMEKAKNGTARNAWAAVCEFLAQEKTPELATAGGFSSWRKRRDSNPR